MIITAINASPRKGGNTSALVEKVLEGARSGGAQVRRIDLSDLNIRPLGEEDYEGTLEGIRRDPEDGLNSIITAIQDSDVVVLASPVFFGSLSGQLKNMIDRFQFAWLEKNFRGKEVFSGGKRGVFISVQAQNRQDFFENSARIVKHFFATLDIEYAGELLFMGLEGKNDAASNPAHMEKAFKLGRGLVLAET